MKGFTQKINVQRTILPERRLAVLHDCQISALFIADTVNLLPVESPVLLEVIKGNFRAFKGTVGAGEVIPVLTLRNHFIKSLFVLLLSIRMTVRITTKWRVRIFYKPCDIGVYLTSFTRIVSVIPVLR